MKVKDLKYEANWRGLINTPRAIYKVSPDTVAFIEKGPYMDGMKYKVEIVDIDERKSTYLRFEEDHQLEAYITQLETPYEDSSEFSRVH